ncbi:CAP domain-containing protein [Dethiobacter alkaliphilus]|uniref:SCP-like extracellular n=1 Tax=Dethiobacter alkaliphilus AHT 1 TaxID=555088 RepID=C0GHZ0_DETAL|nr:CAP domain-containing protein [Dethiobacter alkaliphilus]EEG77064.1 SCP-like extracellular [Dethiobacter alkaliphilus AHT 1]
MTRLKPLAGKLLFAGVIIVSTYLFNVMPGSGQIDSGFTEEDITLKRTEMVSLRVVESGPGREAAGKQSVADTGEAASEDTDRKEPAAGPAEERQADEATPSADSTPKAEEETEKQNDASPQNSPDTAENAPEPKPQEDEDPPFPAASHSQGETQMLDKLNQERIQRDLEPLKTFSLLADVARLKSRDMAENGYFSHTSPTYGTPFEMLTSFGISYGYAGENIAGAGSVGSAHNNFMKSSGHKENILNENYTHVGIGIQASDKYGLTFTQLFISQ